MNLVEYGFRLPSAIDNRPLNFNEFESIEKLSKLIENMDNIDYLKNFINLRGNIKTTK